MKDFFKDFFYESFCQNGFIYVVKVKDFYEKTNFLLTKKLHTISLKEGKSRPIVIVKSENERCKFIALSTYEKLFHKRPSFPIHKCSIEISPCFGLNLKGKKETFVFAKNTATKKRRYLYEVNKHLLFELKKNNKCLYCGHCSEEVIQKSLKFIEDFFNNFF